MRVLRPLSSDTYITMTMWNDKKAYNDWKDDLKQQIDLKIVKNTGIFAGPSYISTFAVGEEEDQE